ncbi:GTP cyclohydrolase subunit MoaA [Thermaerobacter marianensis DSM 12885]|uniref:GTP 3',8-cyclase n=1 Tax=Thermaerobacter marianensis (strain ATCC 700841 / DSM 12885 / JCM 10246 / 7p75a) TaxID=644966 RepID=E6SMN4_THEM7|nr:GTP 3',8-cyclase MoaA [Thermaerobacter marianensis]ADU51526.1 GTP cyclohydrolase subunit MoaA [Thermaerobacter marianensis DSM 12885]
MTLGGPEPAAAAVRTVVSRATDPAPPDMPVAGPLVDRFGRVVRKLRISLTDRCNFRCVYCMPEGDIPWIPSEEILTFDEIERVVRICAAMGVEKLRLTGGEPLLRPGVEELTARLVRVPGIRSVSMTTNGFLLPEKAAALKAAGLSGINISLDSLDRDRFRQLTRRDQLDRVLEGIAAAAAAGLQPIKINAVVMRGINDGEVETFLRWAREQPVDLTVRFIEFMPLDGSNVWTRDLVYTAAEILEQARRIGPVEPVHNDPADPARLYRFADGRGTFGIIASVSQPFCASCDRIRLTADGKIRNCLFAVEEFDLRELLRGGAGDETVAAAIRRAVWVKWRGHLINQKGFVKPQRAMYAIGG